MAATLPVQAKIAVSVLGAPPHAQGYVQAQQDSRPETYQLVSPCMLSARKV